MSYYFSAEENQFPAGWIARSINPSRAGLSVSGCSAPSSTWTLTLTLTHNQHPCILDPSALCAALHYHWLACSKSVPLCLFQTLQHDMLDHERLCTFSCRMNTRCSQREKSTATPYIHMIQSFSSNGRPLSRCWSGHSRGPAV